MQLRVDYSPALDYAEHNHVMNMHIVKHKIYTGLFWATVCTAVPHCLSLDQQT